MAPSVITTGASSTGQVVFRLEINDFVGNIRYFSLYVQALTAMQADPQALLQSHYQVGGIHGKPYTQWDEAGGTTPINPPPKPGQREPWNGYCVHGTVLFPTWHRPYTALYEQIVQAHAAEIANTYTTPDKADWVEAAKTLRLPFWDWNRPATQGVPPEELLTLATVTITGPDGKTNPSYPNPLLGYKFNPIGSDFEDNFKTWPTTLRCPNSASPSAVSQPLNVVANVKGLWAQRTAALISLLRVDSWLEMSNHSRDINPNYKGSLEALHDGMHLNVGGRDDPYGHMSDQDYAGHDPIFYHHHANVDRLLRMWQIIHFDKWIPDSSAEDGTWTIKLSDTLNSKTALTPFWKNTQDFWNSDDVRNPDPLYFTYPILAGLIREDPKMASEILVKRVAEEYRVAEVFPHLHDHVVSGDGRHHQQPLPHQSAGLDWRVHIQCMKHVLGGSYSIFVFLGEVPEDSREWISSPSLVGIHDIFARKDPSTCENCSRNPALLDEGIVFLGPALVKAKIGALTPDVVEPYLRENLHWRLLKVGRGQLPLSDLESLQVSVVSIPMRLEHLPVQTGDVNRHPFVTRERAGGANDMQ